MKQTDPAQPLRDSRHTDSVNTDRAAASKRPKKLKPLTDRQRINFLESLVGRFVLEDCWKSKQLPTGKRRDTCESDLHCGDTVRVYIRDSLSRVIVSASAPTWRQSIDAASQAWANVKVSQSETKPQTK